jgi:hypothetical protein
MQTSGRNAVTIDEFEEKVKEIAGDEHYAAIREESRRRGKRVVTFQAYTERAGWVGITSMDNVATNVLDELRRAHELGRRVQHVA